MAAGYLSIGQLVEVCGLPEDTEESYANGKRGKVIRYDVEEGRYVVQTLEGLTLMARFNNLRVYEPEPPEDGGFDMVWPHNNQDMPYFAALMVDKLMSKDFCVIQLFMSDENRAQALKEAEFLKYKKMRREFERAYLGRSHKSKVAWLDGVAEEKEEMSGMLDSCDFYLSSITQLLLPLAPCALDFMPYSRTNSMARMPMTARELSHSSEEVTEDDIDEGLVDGHIQFVKRRKLCMMFIIETNGGDLTLIPKDETQAKIVLENVKGRLIIFRHDRMSFVYNSVGTEDLVLQSWVLSDPDQLTFKSLDGDSKSKDDAIGLVTGPNTPEGNRSNVVGISVGLPAGGHRHEDSWWAGCASGCDGQVKVPIVRFDMDIYCLDPDSWFPGASYTYHGGFVCDDVYALDNVFFGIEEEEVYMMSPASRKILENAYECLWKGGLRKSTIKGRHMGVFLGHSGDDWSCTQIFTCGSEDKHRRGLQSRIWSTITGRVTFILGVKGPQATIDTACSSALVAYGVGHTMLRGKENHQIPYSVNVNLQEAIMCGANMIPGPGNYINLSGPHMLSALGRCFTFDHSADGFERGEGTGALYVKNEEVMSQGALSSVIGACLNQDGRSASMTAPNGPAQQECIRGSMKEAGLTANQVTCAECHGTGTALGDPIEVGALRGVMQDRVIPIMQTSAKTHIGHLEASAGTAGIIKCIMMCAACAGSPNCHLLVLNPHLDVNGYPTVFSTELSDYGSQAGYSGVSSFGFGGANSRADVFARANRGPHITGEINYEKIDYISITCPFDEGPIHYIDGRVVPLAWQKQYRHKPYHADAIRDEFANYDYSSSLYSGKYQLEPPEIDEPEEPPSEPIYIVGSWDAFREPREMTVDEDVEGTYRFIIALGETRCERFQLHVDKDPYKAIYPIAKDGSMRTRVVGPHDEGEGLFWLLDGRDEEVKAGTVYLITFQWGVTLTMKWDIVEFPAPMWLEDFRHAFFVVGTWTAMTCSEMKDVSTINSPGTWECKVRIGMSGRELFHFERDREANQAIYPARAKAACSADIPARGPDELRNGRSWLLTGKPGEVVTVRLQYIDAHIAVSIVSASGTTTSRSAEGTRRLSYSVAGTFNGWVYEEMTPDETQPGVFRLRGSMGPSLEEFFHISVDAQPELTLFPEVPQAVPGMSIVRGPGEYKPDETCWRIEALKDGATFDVVLNMASPDKRRIVDVTWATERVDVQSMTAAFYDFFGAG